MNLLIELPPRDEKEASGRMIRAFERLMVFASAAKDVILIAPEKNVYWPQWETWSGEYRELYITAGGQFYTHIATVFSSNI